MRRSAGLALLLVLGLGAAARAQSTDALLIVRGAPCHGVVLADVSLPPIEGAGLGSFPGPIRLDAAAESDGTAVPVQVVLLQDGDLTREGAPATIALRLPRGGDHRVKLALTARPAGKTAPSAGPVRTPWIAATHDPAKQGGLPSRIEFLKTGKVFENFNWQDRLHHRQQGGFLLRGDIKPAVETISDGPVCSVVRVRAAYGRGDERPSSRPSATYDWVYFKDAPLVLVRAAIRQQEDFAWDEIHFLELNFPDAAFPRWAGGDPPAEGAFAATKKGFSHPAWGALLDGPNAIGVVRGGQALFYDGRGEYGTYLHAHGDAAWQGWKDRERSVSAWLWMGSDEKPADAVPAAARALPDSTRAVLTTAAVQERIAAAGAAAAKDAGSGAARKRWRVAMAERLASQGRSWEIGPWLDGRDLTSWTTVSPSAHPQTTSWTTLSAGDLVLVLEWCDGRLDVESLYDMKAGRELLPEIPEPLFVLTFRSHSGRELQMTSRSYWDDVRVEPRAGSLTIRWLEPGGTCVVAVATADPARHAIAWTFRVENTGKEWSVWRASFPRVAVGAFGDDVTTFFPRGPGEVKKSLHATSFRYGGTYPDGWTSMQYVAAYDEKAGTGLYVGMHDPEAHTKDLLVEGRPATRDVLFAFDNPAPDMGKPGAGFMMSGRAVWQLLRGDWYDAAQIYRAFIRREAKWFPALGPDGRADTPAWMRGLPAWAQTGGAPKECVGAVKAFQEFLGAPAGFHWYNWHVIPFDNDYPHYFPAKDGFAAGVKDLQDAGVFVMPYINGRLWDTRDRGAEDAEFTRTALAAATKDERGKPITETYGSKEADGSPVTLAVMCPSTELWQRRVRDTVLRLMNECGTKAVYIDQVAAAPPRLCFDPAHGHPLGGGNWWWKGYGRMLEDLRKAMPKDCMITTECNAEPFVKWFDGYLTWHWQFDGQVPAFPAVYGGAIQMFGRAYRGGPTKDLALRMKAGQQLVFGEQLGWLDPGVVNEKGNAEFFRDAVRLRWALRRYFSAGEMARPPRLQGDIPRVQADWQWSGAWPVTTDAVLTGAWRLESENRLVLLFINVSDAPVTAGVRLDLAAYGMKGANGTFRVTTVTPAGPGESWGTPSALDRRVPFEPRTAVAWEVAAP
jgi:hypothetical protein